MTGLIIYPQIKSNDQYDVYCYDEKGDYKLRKHIQLHFMCEVQSWHSSVM